VTPVTGRPRVWPVFIGFVSVFVSVQVMGALVLAAWAYLLTPIDSGVNGFAAALEGLMASPSGLALAAVVSWTGMGTAALMAGALSPEPWRHRLRLSLDGITAGKVVLVIVGLLGVSQALDASVALLGLSHFGALDHINRVMARASPGWLVVLSFALALGPGMAEELFFRGFMQTRLAQRFGAALAIAITSACFGFIHFDLVHTPVAAVLGLFLGWAVERTGSIVPAMAAHVVNNLIAVLTAGVTWLGSTTAQVSALVAGVLLVLVVLLALQRASRRPPLDTPTSVAVPNG
jgi:membrane protease YdiL (CAAX protease family)